MTDVPRRRTLGRGRRRAVTRLATYFTSVATIAGFGAVLATTTPAGAATTPSALKYTALTSPVRIADTRTGATDPSTYAGMTLAAGGSLTVGIPSTIGVPPTAGAVVVNLTATNAAANGFLSVSPGATATSTTSNVNFAKGQTVANVVTVALAKNTTTGLQSFTVYDGPTAAMGGGSVDFTADVEGYYTAGGAGEYHPMTPTRVYDSRTASGYPGAGTTLGAGSLDNVLVGNTAGVPSTATAVVLNVAVTNTTAPSYLQVYPRLTATTKAPASLTSSQNWVAGETLSAQVIAKIGYANEVSFKNYAGSADIVVDVDGYFKATGGSLFTPLSTPKRLLDTRTTSAVNGGSSTSATITGSGATAGVLDVIDLPSSGNYLTAYPKGKTVPFASNVNFTPGNTYDVVPNSVYGTTGTGGAVGIFNGPSSAGAANVVVDEFGYFGPAPSGLVVTSTQSSLAPTGTTHVNVTVTHTGPVATDALLFTTTGGTACGTVTHTATTTAAGKATVTYSLPTVTTIKAGNCTITVRESKYGLKATTTIATVITHKDTITLKVTAAGTGTGASPYLVTQSTSTTHSVSVTATVTGAGKYTDVIDFTVKAATGTAGKCGTVVPTSKTTPAKTTPPVSATVSVTYNAPTGVGFCTVTATEAKAVGGETTPATASKIVDNTATPSPGTRTPTMTITKTVTGVPTATVTPKANGTTKRTVTVTVKNTATVKIAGDKVLISATPATPAVKSCGTLSASTGVTNATGQVSVTYTAGGVPGTCKVSAVEATNGTVVTTTVNQLPPPNVLKASVSNTGVVKKAQTTTKLTITVTGHKATGTALGGVVVTATKAASPTPGGCGTLTPAATATLTAGRASYTYTAGATTGFCTITFTTTKTASTAKVIITQTT